MDISRLENQGQGLAFIPMLAALLDAGLLRDLNEALAFARGGAE